MTRCATCLAAALLGASAPSFAGPVAAEPITAALETWGGTVAQIETVQWGGFGGWYGPGSSAGVSGSPRSHDRHGYDAYAHDSGTVAAAPRASSNAVVSCQQRFRSYDPASGTYRGHDGLRHPCP
jgi:hypothetical protein